MEGVPEHIYTSSEIIDKVLKALGIRREDISTYQDYTLENGASLRLRISDHGVNLSTWHKKNKEQGEENPTLPKLNKSTNIAITFAPTEEECKAKGIEFPQKAINKTVVKTNAGNNVKPQFSVGHIQYASWLLDDSDIQQIATAIVEFTNSGVYTDPIGLSSGKVVAWQNTSTLPPKKLTRCTATIQLNESDLREMIRECMDNVLKEKLNKKKVGEYTAIDGSWWDGFPSGLEGKGCVQDVRMYDRLHKNGTIDTIALFRRIDNRKYFYARIVPVPNSKETKWEPLPLKMVPSVIRNDIRTINPQGHEPYLLS